MQKLQRPKLLNFIILPERIRLKCVISLLGYVNSAKSLQHCLSTNDPLYKPPSLTETVTDVLINFLRNISNPSAAKNVSHLIWIYLPGTLLCEFYAATEMTLKLCKSVLCVTVPRWRVGRSEVCIAIKLTQDAKLKFVDALLSTVVLKYVYTVTTQAAKNANILCENRT